MRVEDGNAAEAKEWDYKGVTCNSAGARDGVDCCRSKRKATELRLGFRLAGRSLPGSSGSLAKTNSGRPRGHTGNRLTKQMREFGTSKLVHWRDSLWESRATGSSIWLYAESILPDNIIKSILDVIFSLTSEEDVASIVEDTMLEASHIESLYAAVQKISDAMKDIRSEDLSTNAQKRREELGRRREAAVSSAQPAKEEGIRWIVNLRCVLGPFTSILLIWRVPNSGNSGIRLAHGQGT